MKYIVLLLLLWGCNPAKKINRLLDKHPDIALPLFRDAYPCTTSKIDTIYNWHDTTLFIDCPPIVYKTDTIAIGGNLSLERVRKVISIRTSTIIKEVEDSAKIKTLIIKLDSIASAEYRANFAAANYKKFLDKSEYRSRTYLIAFLILLIAFLISLFVNYIQSRK
jgi:hypothetical protein